MNVHALAKAKRELRDLTEAREAMPPDFGTTGNAADLKERRSARRSGSLRALGGERKYGYPLRKRSGVSEGKSRS